MRTTPRADVAQQALEVTVGLAHEVDASRDFSHAGLGADLESDLGLGSLERAELITRLERTFACRLPDARVVAARTVRDLADVLQDRPSGGAARERPSTQPPDTKADEAPPPPRLARSLVDVLAYHAHVRPHRPLLHLLAEGCAGRVLTASDLLQESRVCAAALTRHGVARGDRVGIMLPTGAEFLATFFGTLVVGAVAVPLHPPLRPEQAEEWVLRQSAILARAGARILVTFRPARTLGRLMRRGAPDLERIVCADELLGAGPAPLLGTDADEVALLQYTSGSTGAPHGVILTHQNLLLNVAAFGRRLDVRPTDRVVSWLPLYHDMGLIGMLLGSLYHGLPLALMPPEDFLARPSRWLRAIHDFRGTISAGPNFAYDICARRVPDDDLADLDLSCWRVAVNGAEPIHVDTVERFAERFAACGWPPQGMTPAYGLAEAALAVSLQVPGTALRVERIARRALQEQGLARPAHAGEAWRSIVSCGRPVENVAVRVVDDRGRPLEDHCEGRLQFRGASSTSGYFRDPQTTREVRDADGWIDSGDLGYLADGEVFPTGRRKAVILKAGRNLHAEDVEKVAAEVPGVRRGCVAAFAMPAPEQGTEDLIVVAETRALQPAERDALADAVRRRVADALGVAPDRVIMARPGGVPKTPSGKVRRRACRDRLVEGTLDTRRTFAAQWVRLLGAEARFRLGRGVRGLVRGLYGLWYGLCMGAWWGFLGLASILGGRVTARAVPGACRALLRSIGVRLEVSGERRVAGPAVLVANHASMADAMVLSAACQAPLRYVVAPWVARLPLLRHLIRASGALTVVRGDSGQAGRDVERMQAALAEGGVVVAFAEGGLEITEGLRPFVLGPFAAAAQAGVAVVPVALAGTRRLLPWGTRIPRPGPVTVTILPPLHAEGSRWDDVVALAHRARQAVAAHCGEPMVERRLARHD